MHGAMGGYHGFMGSYGSSNSFFTAVSVVSLVCGIIVVMSALVLRIHPEEHFIWGIVIVVFSAISFVGMGGYFVGAGFGIIGGAIALTYKPIL
jgi:bacteriorhodopsin